MSAVPGISVLIVDDSELIREKLCALVRDVHGVGLVELSRDVHEAMRACDTVRPDVAVIDLSLPDGSGLEVLEHVHRTLPLCLTIVLTSSEENVFREHCLAAGADYFFSKGTEVLKVADAIAARVTSS